MTGRALAPGRARALIERYVDAFERYDMDALTALLHEDATMSMPPYAIWLRGHDAIRPANGGLDEVAPGPSFRQRPAINHPSHEEAPWPP